jgi:hypothetical protein
MTTPIRWNESKFTITPRITKINAALQAHTFPVIRPQARRRENKPMMINIMPRRRGIMGMILDGM